MHEVNEQLSYLANDVLLEETPVSAIGEQLTVGVDELKADESETISRNVDTLATAHDSFESYINAFFKTVEEGAWSPRTGRQFEIGLEAIAVAGGVSLESLGFEPSFEDVGKTQTASEHREKSEEKSKNILSRIWEAIKRAFERVYQYFKGLFDKVKRAEKWLQKAEGVVTAKLTKARQTGSFKTGSIEKVPGWAKYLMINGTTGVGANSLTVAAKNIHLVADAYAADAADAADAELQIVRMEFKDGKIRTAVPPEKLKSISWPVQLPGNVSIQITGDTKDFLSVKLEKAQREGTPSKYDYIGPDESTRFITEFRALVETATNVSNSFYRHSAKYEEVRKALREEGEGKQHTFADLTRIMANQNSVVRMLVLEIHQVAKMAYDHAMASVK